MRLAAVVLFLAVAGCAGTGPRLPAGPELVAVIPGPDGHVGAVVVQSGDGEQVLDRAYAARRVMADGSAAPATLTADEVSRAFGGTLQSLPGRPASFTLYFLEGRDELTAASRVEMEKVFAELKRRPAPDIVVIGHTDTVGNLPFNDKLSLARAERMRELMIGLGIAPERIQAAGRGKRELLVHTEDNVSEARNRRVEISVR
jgi:outer membrane protein OmpA-like peptidoglycan-associated protein